MHLPASRFMLCPYESSPSPHRHSASRYAQPAGKTRPGQPEIRLNPVLLLENQQAFIEEVVPHELAHLLVWKHFGRVAPHGKEWKWMMEAVLGVPARRTHQFELESVRRNTFSYRCRCQQHQLTVRRHNRVVRGEATYRCVKCGEPLVAE